ncbi:MAG: hypothetical protein D6732_04685 [Methanobacteriota archaeon]|nr:MAG: hypothetical protein D6732_04685 [Euryarchaeota archaeon]
MPHKRSIKEKLLKGGAWAFAGKLVTVITSLGTNAFLARLLTPEEFGAYFLTNSLASLAAIIAQFGLSQTIVRLIAESLGTKRQARARLAVRLTLRLAGVGAILMACVLAFGGGSLIAKSLFHSDLMAQVMGLVSVWVVLITFQQLMAEIFRGFHDIRLATISGGLVTGLLAMLMLVGLWLVQGSSELDQVITLMMTATLSSISISSFLLWKKLISLPRVIGNEIRAAEIMHIAWPLWITRITLFVLPQMDLWIMGLYRTPEEVAVFGAVAKMVALVTMPLLIVNAVIPPIISELYIQGRLKELEEKLRDVATIAGVPSIIAIIILIIFGHGILSFLFGDRYGEGGVILTILCIGQGVNVLTGSCGILMSLTEHQKNLMRITVCIGVIGVPILIVVVPMYGGVGAAIVTAIQVSLAAISALIYCASRIKIFTLIRVRLYG